MKNNKFGFTLVELLAVIAVLALILIIAVPKITKTLDNSKKRTLELSAKSLARSAEEAYIEKETYGLDEEITCESIANINSDDYSYCNISFNAEGKASITIIGAGQYEGKYICGGSKTESSAANEECTGGIPSDILEERHKFYYYSSMLNAINNVNNGVIGVNQDATKDNAVAGVYTYNNKNYVILLKDSKETERLKPSVDMIINLNGKTLTSEDTVVFDIISGNIIIDGKSEGSKIESILNMKSRVLQIRSGSLKVNGGTYIAETKNDSTDVDVAVVYSGGNVYLSDAVFIAKGISCPTQTIASRDGEIEISNSYITATCDNCKSYAVFTSISNKKANLSNNKIKVSALDGIAIGVYSIAETKISDCDIRTYSNIMHDNEWLVYSMGIWNTDDLHISNSYALGNYAGIYSEGNLYVDGGTYEGYMDGGVSFKGDTSYIKNATIREVMMPDGYTSNKNGNGTGMSIISRSDINNFVYIDNSNIYGTKNQIMMSGNSNSLYISNSRLHDLDNDNILNINIGNNNKLYIGRGNNFTKENTNLPEIVTETNEVYVKNEK